MFSLILAAVMSFQISNITVKAQWNPNTPSEAVTQYTLIVDGGAPITVLPSACTLTVCEQAITLTFASHTFSLTATNEWGTSPATLFTANLSVSSPSNFRVVR